MLTEKMLTFCKKRFATLPASHYIRIRTDTGIEAELFIAGYGTVVSGLPVPIPDVGYEVLHAEYGNIETHQWHVGIDAEVLRNVKSRMTWLRERIKEPYFTARWIVPSRFIKQAFQMVRKERIPSLKMDAHNEHITFTVPHEKEGVLTISHKATLYNSVGELALTGVWINAYALKGILELEIDRELGIVKVYDGGNIAIMAFTAPRKQRTLIVPIALTQ